MGRQRGAGLGGSHDEREQTLNQILVEMDGIDTDTNVIIIAATNRPDILDPALLRPGRFDRRIVLDRPDIKGREAILEVHVKGKPLADDIDLRTVAKSTPGFVGADIESLVNESAILAARHSKKAIEMVDFQEAVERVIAGPERKSRIMSDEEKRVTAYHEAGHAVVARVLPEHEGGPGGRADRAPGVVLGEPRPLRRHAIEARRRDLSRVRILSPDETEISNAPSSERISCIVCQVVALKLAAFVEGPVVIKIAVGPQGA